VAALLDHAVDEGFLRTQHRAALHVAAEPGALLDAFEGWEPPRTGKWLERDGVTAPR
jgi:predicted Rossmann-fold nucleotide-binding protein